MIFCEYKRTSVTRFLDSIRQTLARLRYRFFERRWAKTLRLGFRPPTSHSVTDRNIWYLYVEVFWAAILSAAAAFNATFAVRLGATNQMIGWLSSIPALLATVLLVPFARFLERRGHRAPWIWGGLLVARIGYGTIALLPWLVSETHQAGALVALLIAISIPSTLFSTGWSPLLADVVPERERARVLANRSIIAGVAIAGLTFVAGKWLEGASTLRWAQFPRNFQLVYAVGFVGAMLSMVFLLKIKVPPSKIVERSHRPHGERRSLKAVLAELHGFAAANRGFVRLIVNTFVFSFGEWMIGPLYTIFFVRTLQASDSWIGLNSTLANIGVIVGYSLWRRWVEKLGYHRTLLVTIPLSASYAFLVGLFPNLTAILAFGVFINLVNPGLNLSHFNIMLELCPEERRASYIAVYSALMNAGAFVAPMLGVALTEFIDIRWMLIIGAGIRLIGAALFHLYKLQLPHPQEA